MRIEPRSGWTGFVTREAWQSRELLVFLAERDLRVRYKQTFFGALWAIGQPLLTMVVFTLVFGRVAKLPSQGIPYAILALGGTVPWSLVAGGLANASNSLVQNEALITKVYIPKMLLPAATILATLVDTMVALTLLVIVAAFYGVWPSWHILALPLFIALGAAIVFGLGLLLSAVNVVYRDVRYVVPYLIQAWLFASPVGYAMSAVDSRLRPWFAINPMTGVIEGFRWSVLGTHAQLGLFVTASVIGAVVLLIVGGLLFRRLEPSFADVV
jgi:lipopolysaccharide transport system permease protein